MVGTACLILTIIHVLLYQGQISSQSQLNDESQEESRIQESDMELDLLAESESDSDESNTGGFVSNFLNFRLKI